MHTTSQHVVGRFSTRQFEFGRASLPAQNRLIKQTRQRLSPTWHAECNRLAFSTDSALSCCPMYGPRPPRKYSCDPPSPTAVSSNRIECFLTRIACCMDQIGQSRFEISRFHMLRNLSGRRTQRPTNVFWPGQISSHRIFSGHNCFADAPSLDRFEHLVRGIFPQVSTVRWCGLSCRLDYCSGLDAKFIQDGGASCLPLLVWLYRREKRKRPPGQDSEAWALEASWREKGGRIGQTTVPVREDD